MYCSCKYSGNNSIADKFSEEFKKVATTAFIFLFFFTAGVR